MEQDVEVKQVKENTWFILVTVLCAVSSISLVGVQWFRWTLVDVFTPFIEPLLENGVVLVFLVSAIASFIYFIVKVRGNWKFSILPLSISVLTIAVITLVPFDSITRKLNFDQNFDKRVKIVHMVESGQLRPGDSDLVLLPPEYQFLSAGGGEIVVETKDGILNVLFYDFRGILDSFSGFIYRSDNSPPLDYQFDGDFKQFIKLREHWYWGTSY